MYVCTHVTSDSVNHAALWMFPVAKRRYLSHNSANWPEWPMRTGWASTASAHLLHSSAGRNLVKDYEQIQKRPPPFHNWFSCDIAFNRRVGCERASLLGLHVWPCDIDCSQRNRNGTNHNLGVYQVACWELLNFSLTGHSDCDSNERTVGST